MVPSLFWIKVSALAIVALLLTGWGFYKGDQYWRSWYNKEQAKIERVDAEFKAKGEAQVEILKQKDDTLEAIVKDNHEKATNSLDANRPALPRASVMRLNKIK